jgi:hypothetical protein
MKTIFLALIIVFSGVASAMAFDPMMVNEMDIQLSGTTGSDNYVSYYRIFEGKGSWLVYVPCSVTIPYGRMGTLKVYESEAQYYPDPEKAHWNLLLPGSKTPTWGVILKIVSDRDDEIVELSGQMWSGRLYGLSYLDLRDNANNVKIFVKKGIRLSYPVNDDEYYYNYGVLLLAPGRTIKGKVLLQGYGNSTLWKIAVCNKDGFLIKLVSAETLADYTFNSTELPVLIWKKPRM